MKNILLFIVIILSQFSFGQDSISFDWKAEKSFDIDEESHWTVDAFENVILSNRGAINKYNVDGGLIFSQSIKSLGRMSQLVLINTMKLVHFSEEQQTLCYFDNTLSEMDDCIDLTEFGIVNAFLVSSSSQPNKMWVLDNFNSTLSLLSMDGTFQSQKTINLKGVLDMENVTQILERGNSLFVLDSQKGVYQFDLYGSLVRFIPYENVMQFAVVGKTLYMLTDEQLIVHAIEFNDSFQIKLPLSEIEEIKEVNHHFYFRTKTKVHKFELVFQ